MPAKLTLQDFVDRARAVHGDRYGYAFSVYQGNHVKLMIHCREHGFFEQVPSSHFSGSGCPNCAETIRNNKKRLSLSEFINRANVVHKNKYDYSLVNYSNNNTKVKIKCKTHDVFEQTPGNHLSGVGCPNCSGTKKYTRESFIQKARMFHGDKYDYSNTVYESVHIKVKIVCTEHGEFTQRPSDHFKGKGCPGCAKYGFDRTRSASLYVLRSDCGRYMKIGITHNPKQRHNTLKRDTPFSFKCVEIIEGTGEQIVDLEKELLAEYQPVDFSDTFDGSTEWRLWDELVSHKLLTVTARFNLHV